MQSDLPPAIVLGVDSQIGLTIVRELGEHGIAVHGIARTAEALGIHSRWLHRAYRRPSSAAELIELLNRIARESGAPFVLTVAMSDSLSLRAAADAGALVGCRPLVASVEKLELVNDKAAICAIAETIGIRTPATWEPGLEALQRELPETLTFPSILKWRDPEIVRDRLARQGLPLRKSEFVYGPAALRSALERYRPFGTLPMVQSYSPGRGLGQMFLMKDGVAALRFQHRRLHEWPPEGGISTLCESLGPDENRELLAKSESLLRAIGWEGSAMVEYRHDGATGRAELMEINGRFWGSLPLAYHAGVHFALGTYYALGLDRPPPQSAAYRAGMRCRFMIPETKRLLRIAFRKRSIPDRAVRFSLAGEILGYFAGFLDLRRRYYVFSLRDPKPFLVGAPGLVRKAVRFIPSLFIRKRRAVPRQETSKAV